ncbi:MAG: response regulator [Gemmatimonadota bacterium]|nr:response regulator [Gemmatimonadota bacterium]
MPQGLRILLVEDEASVRLMVGRMLRSIGSDVVPAADGREAWRMFATRERAYDLVLSDVVMPILGGGELAARILAEVPDQAIVLMSAMPRDTLADQLRRIPELPFLSKPFSVEQLVAIVARTQIPRRAAAGS